MPLDPDRRRTTTTFLRDLKTGHELSEDEINRIARLYYESSPNLWASVTSDGAIRHVNPTWERVTGFSLTESRRLKFQDFFIEDAGHAAAILDGLKWEDFRGGQRLRLVQKSGATVIVGVRAEKFDAEGLAHVRLIDMTIRATMDERLAKLQREHEKLAVLSSRIIENDPMMIAIAERDGVYRYVSPACKTVLLVDPGVLVGKNAFQLIHPKDISIVQQVFEKMLKHSGRADRMSVRFLYGQALQSWRPDTLYGDRDYVMIESTGINLIDDPNVSGFITYTQVWRLPPATGGGANDDPRFSRAWDHGDDYGADHDDMPERWRG
jgi:PAS domain S-box-containing protein